MSKDLKLSLICCNRTWNAQIIRKFSCCLSGQAIRF